MDIFLSFSCQRGGGEEKVGIFQYVIEFVEKTHLNCFLIQIFFGYFFMENSCHQLVPHSTL
jgi:hypothetical protein